MILGISCTRTSLESEQKDNKLSTRDSELSLPDELERVISQGTSSDSYLNVVVVGNEGQLLTNWQNYTFNSQPVLALYSKQGPNDPQTDCCMVTSITKLSQVCSERLNLIAPERGLDWDQNIYQAIKVRTDKIVNGNYINIAEKEFPSYQEWYHDAYCSQPISHGHTFFFKPGELTYGHYRITYKKGFYNNGDPQFVQCDEFVDQDISYLP